MMTTLTLEHEYRQKIKEGNDGQPRRRAEFYYRTDEGTALRIVLAYDPYHHQSRLRAERLGAEGWHQLVHLHDGARGGSYYITDEIIDADHATLKALALKVLGLREEDG